MLKINLYQEFCAVLQNQYICKYCVFEGHRADLENRRW